MRSRLVAAVLSILCAAAPAPARAADAPPPDAAADARLRALEDELASLRDRVLRTRARVAALQDAVVGGDLAAGARTLVVHRNEMGSSYVLEAATFAVDGAAVFARVDRDGDLDRRAELDVFAGRLAPGPHQLAVKLVYRARGAALYGAHEGERVEVRSSHLFEVAAGRVTTVRVVGVERGGLTTRLAERPMLRFEVAAAPEPPPPAGSGAAAGAGAR